MSNDKEKRDVSSKRELYFTRDFAEPLKGPGSQIGQFRIEGELDRGGAGIVYLAQDTKLDRKVAIKSISSDLINSPAAKSRFEREAKILASLNHPNIAAIYEEIEDEGQVYLVLEYVSGETLQERINKGKLSLEEVLAIALSVADAMSTAHENGIVHRDLKPGNIRITPEGRTKVLDFGIAKMTGDQSADGQSVTVTKAGTVMGTPGYMSPEQIRGQSVDPRTDIWSFGCVLYEILTGKSPFPGSTTSEVLASILTKEPDLELPPVQADRELRRIVDKCLRKELERRYQSASELQHDLLEYQQVLTTAPPKAVDPRSLLRLLHKPTVAVPTLLVVACLCVAGYRFLDRAANIRWARMEAIPEIMQLIEQHRYFDAFSLATEAERYIPEDPVLEKLWPGMSQGQSITTVPVGASVFYKEYADTEGEWLFLGETPLEDVRFPLGFYRWKITKDGYETREAARLVNKAAWTRYTDFHLCVKRSIPSEMVFVPDANTTMAMIGFHPREKVDLGPFLIDKFEVTNKQFKEFVDNGGYEKQEYWEHDFVKEGRKLTWKEALEEFRDATGWSGPRMWRYGRPPDGQDDHPVVGISWYEAAAYAKYRGKVLPTIYHWCRAAMATHTGPSIMPQSNYGIDGPKRIGSTKALGFHGTYDMAGNVREWCYNAVDDSGNERYILGGAWGEPNYMFTLAAFISRFDRSLKNGLRCMKYTEEDKTTEERREFLTGPRNLAIRDVKKEKPIPDDQFELMRTSVYSYDRSIPFDVELKTYDNVSDKYNREMVTINTVYGGERMGINIFTPKDNSISPPYQAAITFPGMSAINTRSSEEIKPDTIIIESGRAVVKPNYKGMYERDPLPFDPTTFNEAPISAWVKDWMRTIDYLETREDIDTSRLVYLGGSLGGYMGGFLSAPKEPRFKACVLVLGGIPCWEVPRPDNNQVNYLPRIKMPVLMINGGYDYIFPLETSAKPMFELLGTPEEDKYHIVIPEAEHGGWDDKKVDEKVLQFIDKYLGRPASSR